MLALKTCSTCNHWFDRHIVLDGVLASQCRLEPVRDRLGPATYKITKGSDKCGQWTALKFKEQYNPFRDEIEKVRDYS